MSDKNCSSLFFDIECLKADLNAFKIQFSKHKHKIKDITDFPGLNGNSGKFLSVYNNTLIWKTVSLSDLLFRFTDLIDVPNSYVNNHNKILAVNNTEDRLIFIDLPHGFSGNYDDLINKPLIPTDTSQLTNGAGFITIGDVPKSETTNDVIADMTVGAISAGDIVQSGTNIQELVERLLTKIFYPTFINPSFSISNNAGTNEVGSSVTFNLIFSFDRGQIVGNLSSGIWNPSLFQNYRAGVASSYTLNGVTQSGNTLSVTTTVLNGINSFYGTVSYLNGVQPLDSKGNNYSSPLLGGTSPSQVTSFNGIYPFFYYKSSSPITYSSMKIAIENGAATKVVLPSTGTLNISFNANGEYIAFAYPSSSITKTIWYVNALNSGGIGGSTNLFNSAVVQSINSPTSLWSNINFKIHISNFPTTTSGVMELRNS